MVTTRRFVLGFLLGEGGEGWSCCRGGVSFKINSLVKRGCPTKTFPSGAFAARRRAPATRVIHARSINTRTARARRPRMRGRGAAGDTETKHFRPPPCQKLLQPRGRFFVRVRRPTPGAPARRFPSHSRPRAPAPRRERCTRYDSDAAATTSAVLFPRGGGKTPPKVRPHSKHIRRPGRRRAAAAG